jgi:RimJ/RimL family protein N-acetyltransferase
VSFIETDRLLLRTWILPGDISDAQDLFVCEDAQRYYVRGTLRHDDVAAYVARLIAKEERDGFGVWPVVEKESRSLVAACGLTRVPDLGNDVEVDWIVKPSARGRGIALEAAQSVLSYAFSQTPLPRVSALIDPGNSASIAIANRLGMRFDRIVRAYKRDLMRYIKERS